MRSIAFHLNCLTHGGSERVVSTLANYFAAEGYTVYVATEWQDPEEFPLDERVHRVHVGLREADEQKGRIAKFLLRIRYLKEFLRQYHPDILVAFMKRANFRALMATRHLPVPVCILVILLCFLYDTGRIMTCICLPRRGCLQSGGRLRR